MLGFAALSLSSLHLDTPVAQLLGLLLLGLPLALLASYSFHLLFEKPFLSKQAKLECLSQTYKFPDDRG